MDGGAFLDRLEPPERAELDAAATVRSFDRGVTVFHEGDDAGAVLVLSRGLVKVVTRAPDGREVVLGLAGPGDLLGELSAVTGTPRSAGAVALEDVEAIGVPGSAFRALLERHPRVALVLLDLVAARLRAVDRKHLEYATHGVLGRVALRLVELAERSGRPVPGGIEISVGLTQDELAGWTGASREAVSKALTALRALGWITTARRSITVLDLEALRSCAS